MAKQFSVDDAFEGTALQKRSAIFRDDDELTDGIAIRFHKKRYAAVKKIFDEKGIGFSVGIRSIVYDWLKQNL